MKSEPLRIAMWSGPRNLSTALMRSFSSRPDTAVSDEPFYAYYLLNTGIDHPGRGRVIAENQTDWKKIIHQITGPIPGQKAIWYQKHMAHHMQRQIDSHLLTETQDLKHAFLIRNPTQVISSYTKVHPRMTLDETGLPYQADLFARFRDLTGSIPPVIDANDVLINPYSILSKLCQSLGIVFDESMLHWPAGPHPSDGIWAPYWYASVYRSTGFEKYLPKCEPVPEHLQTVLQKAQVLYNEMHQHRLH